MYRTLFYALPLIALSFASPPGGAWAEDDQRHPRLHAALAELREARAELRDAKDTWPPGVRDRALEAIEGATKSLKGILAVKGDDFRGLDRGPDYYKRYKNHPRLRSAVADLREAREELRASKADFGDLRERALDDIDIAVGCILILIKD